MGDLIIDLNDEYVSQMISTKDYMMNTPSLTECPSNERANFLEPCYDNLREPHIFRTSYMVSPTHFYIQTV